MLSVLVDANLLPLRTFNQYHVLRTANKMAALPATHNISKIFTHNYNTSIQRRHQIQLGARIQLQPAKVRTYTDKLLQLEHEWQCKHTDDVCIINQKARDYMKVEWHDEPHYGLVLKSVKTQCARSDYLYLANRADKRMIARFRHNRIGHNESMYRMNLGRAGTASTPNCATCPTSAESIEHLLLHCPAYTTQRATLAVFLQSVHLPLTMPVLLAEELSSSDTRTADTMIHIRMTIKHIAGFLRHICTERQFTII